MALYTVKVHDETGAAVNIKVKNIIYDAIDAARDRDAVLIITTSATMPKGYSVVEKIVQHNRHREGDGVKYLWACFI